MTPVDDSPCIKVCVIDPKTALCIGCGRTPDEISTWDAMDRPAREGIARQLPTRLMAMSSRRARGTRPSVKHA
ncbi:MAG: DUF1289 domain-containing protein [Proteobacteria bacterium]|nr:DUF1289 domain-containing protein [Pseudomonadota bacterium]